MSSHVKLARLALLYLNSLLLTLQQWVNDHPLFWVVTTGCQVVSSKKTISITQNTSLTHFSRVRRIQTPGAASHRRSIRSIRWIRGGWAGGGQTEAGQLRPREAPAASGARGPRDQKSPQSPQIPRAPGIGRWFVGFVSVFYLFICVCLLFVWLIFMFLLCVPLFMFV